MKKRMSTFLAGFLLLSMIIVPRAMAAEASHLYYLWDIPFGVSESEFIEQAYAKTGFNFVPHSGDVEDSFKIVTDENQSTSFLGHPLSKAQASFRLDSEGNLSYYRLSLPFDVESKTISETVSLFDSVRLVLQEKYGVHTFAVLYSTEGKLFTCDAIEGGFDAQQVTNIFNSDDTIRILEMGWKNLGISMVQIGPDEMSLAFVATNSIPELSEPLESYENRNAPSDAGL